MDEYSILAAQTVDLLDGADIKDIANMRRYDAFACLARYGRWGTCVDCPRRDGHIYPDECAHTNRYDHDCAVPRGVAAIATLLRRLCASAEERGREQAIEACLSVPQNGPMIDHDRWKAINDCIAAIRAIRAIGTTAADADCECGPRRGTDEGCKDGWIRCRLGAIAALRRRNGGANV